MNIMPISYYPMPSDENSQIDVLEESKADISRQSQDVAQSNLNDSQKTQLSDKLEQKEGNINDDIRQKEVKEDYNKKLQEKNEVQQSVKESEIEKQGNKTKLDITRLNLAFVFSAVFVGKQVYKHVIAYHALLPL